MQASDRVLAWRYGKALFQAAGKDAARVQADFSAAHGAILDCMPVLKNPRASVSEKKKRLEKAVGGKVSPVALKFLELLVEKKRFPLFPLVASNLGKLVAEQNNTAKAQVRTARPLSPKDQERLKASLKGFAGKEIELEVKEDPELLGGVVVRLGDWVLDSSLRGRLRRLGASLA